MQRKASAGQRRRPYSIKPVPAKPSVPRRLGGFLKRHKKIVVSALVALLVAAGIQFREVLIAELFPKDKLGDDVRALRGEDSLQIARVTPIGDPNGGPKFVRTDGYTFQGADAEAVRDVSGDHGRAVLSQVQNAGVPLIQSAWQILLHGNSKQGVQILGMRPTGLKRTEPATGTLVYLPSQGVDDSTVMGVNGDDPDPVVRKLAPGADGEVAFGEPYFTVKTIHLDDREDQVVLLEVVTKKYDVSLSLEVDYQVGAEKHQTVLNDNGKPFRVTGFRCRDGAPDYGAYYTTDVSGTGHVGVVPTDAASVSDLC